MSFASDAARVLQLGIAVFKRSKEARHIDRRHVDHRRAVEHLVAHRVRRFIDVDGADDEQVGRQRQLGADAGACRAFERHAVRMQLQPALGLHAGQHVGQVVLDARQIHLVKDDEDRGLAVRGRDQHSFEEGRHDIAVREDVEVAG